MTESKHFSGSACFCCEGTLRYVKGGQCVRCARERTALRNKLYPVSASKNAEYKRRHTRSHKGSESRRRYQWRVAGYPEPTRPRPAACECCGGPPSGKGKAVLGLDHCHATNVFRGWLCHKCNLGIGLIGDSVAGVTRALNYLKTSEEATNG